MSDFKVKMHTNSISAGARPLTPVGSLQRSPDSLAVFKGPTSKGREGKREGEGKRRWKGGEGKASQYFGLEPPLAVVFSAQPIASMHSYDIHCRSWV